MNKKLKVATIVTSIYLILALTATIISPRIFDISGRQGSGMQDGLPILMQAFLLVVLLVNLVGLYLVPLFLTMILPHKMAVLLCNSGEGIPSCSAIFGIFVAILFNTIICFYITYFIAGKFFKESEVTTLRSRVSGYITIITVIILAYLLLKILI